MTSLMVVGSLHWDVVVKAPHIPAPDETVSGECVNYVFGGKGGNQAVAGDQHGAVTHFVGRVGRDAFGTQILNRLNEFKKGYSLAGFKTLNNMLSDIGKGGVIIKDIIPKILPDLQIKIQKEIDSSEFIDSARSDADGINLDGVKNLVVNYGKCCNPIPGDDVIGYLSLIHI